MNRRRVTTFGAIAASALAIAGFGAPALIHAADHLDAPAVNGALQSPGNRHDADIADAFIFRSQEHSDRTVLAMTTHPFLGAITTDPTYGTDITYNFHLDPDGGSGPRQTIVVSFDRAKKDGSQKYRVTLLSGRRHEMLGQGETNQVSELTHWNGRSFAGNVSDPFFFDLGAFNNTVQGRLDQHILPLNVSGPATCSPGQGIDTFALANANAIVLEVPSSLLWGKVDLWTSTAMRNGTPIDRMSRPAINTVFNGKKALLNEGDDLDKNIFNNIPDPSLDPTTHTSPDAGPTFHDNVVTVLDAFDSVANAVAGIPPRSSATIEGLADFLLPDVLPYDPAVASTNGVTNGRSLTDDVIDTELPIVTNGLVSTDCVGPHTDLRSTFPYMGTPH